MQLLQFSPFLKREKINHFFVEGKRTPNHAKQQQKQFFIKKNWFDVIQFIDNYE